MSLIHTLLFEQPLNEQIRVCLKLEYLFSQLDQALNESGALVRQGIESVVQILNVLDRPEFKSKLVKELYRISNVITKLSDSDKIDQQKLKTIFNELDRLIEALHSTTGKLNQDLRDNDFLNSIKQQSANPGGLCGFELPAYWLWLNQPVAQSLADLKTWDNGFETMRHTVTLLLKLIRESTLPMSRIAESGFYQMGLDPQAPIQLLQLYLPKQTLCYPDMSIGRHGVSIRFYKVPTSSQRRTPVTQDIAFKISVCAI